jgi:hypothetical protein
MYSAYGDTQEKRQDTSRRGFNRAVKDAQAKGLIGVSEFEEVQHMWFVRNEHEGKHDGF